MNFSRKYNYIEHDSETRWNSTYRMPDVRAKSEVSNHWILHTIRVHTEILFFQGE